MDRADAGRRQYLLFYLASGVNVVNSVVNREIVMLLVEDNPADVVFFKVVLEELKIPTKLHVVTDGVDAMDFLHGRWAGVDVARPDVLVLDLNLPRMSGQEVLKQMAADQDLARIPVAILTTSTSERWVCDILPPGRCLYFVKTADPKDLVAIIKKINAHAATAQVQ